MVHTVYTIRNINCILIHMQNFCLDQNCFISPKLTKFTPVYELSQTPRAYINLTSTYSQTDFTTTNSLAYKCIQLDINQLFKISIIRSKILENCNKSTLYACIFWICHFSPSKLHLATHLLDYVYYIANCTNCVSQDCKNQCILYQQIHY